MGSKHAVVHLRCDNSAEVLAKLKKDFHSKKGPGPMELAALAIIKALAAKNIRAIADPTERAEKKAAFSQMITQTLTSVGAEEAAVLVVRRHFVSIYWYDHIRIENLREETLKYARRCGVPAMGVGIYDDTNFSIYAVCNAGEPNARSCRGEYWFDFDNITPVKAEEICAIIDAPFFLDALQKALGEDDGESMAAAFEQETGLPILMCQEECRERGMRVLYRWGGATVYLEE